MWCQFFHSAATPRQPGVTLIELRVVGVMRCAVGFCSDPQAPSPQRSAQRSHRSPGPPHQHPAGMCPLTSSLLVCPQLVPVNRKPRLSWPDSESHFGTSQPPHRICTMHALCNSRSTTRCDPGDAPCSWSTREVCMRLHAHCLHGSCA